MGYWVNDALMNFQTTEVIEAKKLRNSLYNTSLLLDTALNKWQSDVIRLNDCANELENIRNLSENQSDAIDYWTEQAEKERKKRIRSRRFNHVILLGAFIGGFYLGTQ